MSKVLLFEEIKKGEHVKFSESYDVKYWYKNNEGYLRQSHMKYYTEARDSHLVVQERFIKDFPGCDIISVTYE